MLYFRLVFVFVFWYGGVVFAGGLPLFSVRDDAAAVRFGKSVDIDVLANDTYPASGETNVLLVTQPKYGSVTLISPGVLQYLSAATSTQEDTFTYRLANGNNVSTVATVRITVRIVGDNTVAYSGMTIPGAGSSAMLPENAVFRSFSVPGIDDSGEPAFLATYKGTGEDGIVVGEGIFAGEPLRLVAHTGQSAPDGNGSVGSAGNFASFQPPLLNSVSDLAFVAEVKDSTQKRQTGIWYQAPGDQLKRILSLQSEVAGVPNAKWRRIHSVVLTDAGTLPFVASLVLGRGGVTSESSLGLWIASEQGVIRILQRGKHLSLGGVKKRIKNFAALSDVPGSPGHNRLSSAGAFPIRITWDDGSQMIVECGADGMLTPKLATGYPVPGVDGARFGTFGFPALNRDGLLTVRAVLKSRQASSVKNKEAIVVEQSPGTYSVTPREQDWHYYAGRPNRLGEPVTNAELSVAHLGALTYPGVPGPKFRKTLQWWNPTNSPVQVVPANVVLRGYSSFWRAFTSVAYPDTAAGQPIFTGARSVVRPFQLMPEKEIHRGLWIAKPDAEPKPIAVAGQFFQTPVGQKLIQSVVALTSVPGSPAQRRSYNAIGQIIFRLDLSGGTQVIVRNDLP